MDIKNFKDGDSGKEVRQCIEENFKNLNEFKTGYQDKVDGPDGKSSILRSFASEADRDLYESDTEKYAAKLLYQVIIPAMNASSSIATLRISVTEAPSAIVAENARVALGFTYYSFYDEITEPNATKGVVKFTINGTQVADLTSELVHRESYVFDLTPYLIVGDNSIIAIVNNNDGSQRTLSYNVSVRQLSVSLVGFNQMEAKAGAFNITAKVVGSAATVFVLVDEQQVAAGTVNAGAQRAFVIPAQETNGVHTISIYATATDVAITTDTQVYEFISDVDGSPAIGVDFPVQAATVYDTIVLRYWVFSKAAEGAIPVRMSIESSDGQELFAGEDNVTLTGGVSAMIAWNIPLTNEEYIGDITLVLEAAGVRRELPLHVNMIDDVTLAPASDCRLFLASAGRSNTASNKAQWISKEKDAPEIAAIFSENFDFSENGSGWNTDSDGNVACHIRSGARVTIPYTPFDKNYGQGNDLDNPGTKTGKMIEVELATRNCVNMNAPVLTCYDPVNGVGIKIFANGTTFSSSGSSTFTDFKEETHIRLGFMVECDEQADRCFMSVIADGVPQGITVYSKADTFKQATPQQIVIGSDECDVDLYAIRIYDKSLTIQEIIGNYAYDTPKAADKVAIARRNDVFDNAGNVNYAKLRKALPNLPILVLETPSLPAVKGEKTQVPSTTFENPLSTGVDDAPSFTAENAVNDVQGTSSSKIEATEPEGEFKYRNYKEDYKEGFLPVGLLEKLIKYQLKKGLPGEKKFCYKINYMSSEMCNNTVLAELYNRVAVSAGLLTGPQQEQAEEGKEVTYRQTIFGFPMCIYWKKPGESRMKYVSMFDFNNDKGNLNILGFDRDKYPKAEIWEVSDNITFFDHSYRGCWVDETGKIQNDITAEFESRLPGDSEVNEDCAYGEAKTEGQVEQANKECASLVRFCNWMYSTNQELATGKPLSQTYTDKDGKEYTVDNASYRLAKFLTEKDGYLDWEKVIYYYNFTARHLMIDSRAKNMHLVTEDGIHFYPVLYDADTAEGNDNNGKLSYPYYYEDTDLDAGRNVVFNGQKSALWINVREGFAEAIATQDRTLRSSAGYSYEEEKALFDSHREQWCEALFAYAAWALYKNNPAYIEAALGDKKHQRNYWMYYSYRYWDSKFHSGDAPKNNLVLRVWGRGADLTVVPYCCLYPRAEWGSTNKVTTQRCLDLKNGVTFKNQIDSDVSNFIIYVFSSDLIVDLGDLSQMGDIQIDDVGAAPRLRRLLIGRDEEGFVNKRTKTLSLNKNRMLEELDISNCEGFGLQNDGTYKNYTLDLSNNTLLRALRAKGSTVTGFSLPQTDKLETLQLPEGLTTLALINLPNLGKNGGDFSILDTSELVSVSIRNCPAVDSRAIIEDCLSHEVQKLANVNITDILWNDFSLDYLFRLAEMKAELTGVINLKQDSANMPNFAQKRAMIEAFGDIDDPNNKLYVTYRVMRMNAPVISGNGYYPDTGTYQMVYAATPSTANNFRRAKWSITTNSYADITEDGVLTVKKVGGAGAAEVTLTMELLGGEEISSTRKIFFYLPDPKPGDYVYCDGSYSDIYDANRSVIGICFYVNGNDRRMIAIDNLATVPWGRNDLDIPDLKNYTVVDGANSSLTISDETYRENDNTTFKEFISGALSDWDGKKNTDRMHEQALYALQSNGLYIPQNMRELVQEMADITDDTTRRLYYPASFYCKMYEPKIKNNETLNGKFTAGNWYLPSCGELARIVFYALKGYIKGEEGTDLAIFADAATNGIFAKISANWIWSSTECSSGSAWVVHGASGQVGNGSGKASSYVVRCVAAF